MQYHSPAELMQRLQGNHESGLYYIRAKSEDVICNLSMELYAEYMNREPSQDPLVIYIGKADGCGGLHQRLKQELYHKGAGTFFRGIGAVMGKNPKRARTLSGIKNYRFGLAEVGEIVYFIEHNIKISVVLMPSENIKDFEKQEISKYKPIFNTTYNPCPSQCLRQARIRCRAHAAEFLI